MKTCPTCQRQYADEEMKFCLDDGSVLLEKTGATNPRSDDMSTWQMSGQSVDPPPTLVAPTAPPLRTHPGTSPTAASFAVAADRRRPGVVLWIALALIVGGSGIVIALIVTRGRQATSTSEVAAANASPTQTLSIAEATPSSDPGNSFPATQSLPANRASEKPTPLSKSTPPVKDTPVKTDVREEPAQPKPTPPRAPLSGGVLNGKAVRLVQPPYPAIARSAHASGQVRVQVLIDENGNVISATPVSGHPLLQGAAVSAARQSKFTPTTLSGQPVKVSGVIIYNFVAQ